MLKASSLPRHEAPKEERASGASQTREGRVRFSRASEVRDTRGEESQVSPGLSLDRKGSLLSIQRWRCPRTRGLTEEESHVVSVGQVCGEAGGLVPGTAQPLEGGGLLPSSIYFTLPLLALYSSILFSKTSTDFLTGSTWTKDIMQVSRGSQSVFHTCVSRVLVESLK